MKNVLKDFYIYNLNFLALAAAASATDSFNIQADAAFRLEKLTFFADIAAATQTDATRVIPSVTLLLTDTGSGRQMMSGAVPISSFFGTGQFPFIMQQPKIFAPRATVSVTVANFDTAATYNIKLSFIGTKLFNINQ